VQARAGSDRGLSGDELAAIATSNTGRATRRMADDCWRVRLRSAMRDGAVMKRWGSPQRLAKTIVFFEPPPSVWDEETYLAYRSQAIQARKRRSRLRWSVGVIPALAALIIITVAAAVLLAVPRWRRWLLSQELYCSSRLVMGCFISLLRNLSKLGVTGATVFPGFQGAANKIIEEASIVRQVWPQDLHYRSARQ